MEHHVKGCYVAIYSWKGKTGQHVTAFEYPGEGQGNCPSKCSAAWYFANRLLATDKLDKLDMGKYNVFPVHIFGKKAEAIFARQSINKPT